MYFGDYEVLPSKMNLADLAKRVTEEKSNPAALGREPINLQGVRLAKVRYCPDCVAKLSLRRPMNRDFVE